jgi:hypothetical protein
MSHGTISPFAASRTDALTPKYHDASDNGDPYAQIDQSTAIRQQENNKENWCSSGY